MFKKDFKAKLIGRSRIEYSEGERRLVIPTEMLFGKFDLAIYLNQIEAWLPPFENSPFSEDDKERIKANISKILSKKKIRADWH